MTPTKNVGVTPQTSGVEWMPEDLARTFIPDEQVRINVPSDTAGFQLEQMAFKKYLLWSVGSAFAVILLLLLH